MMAEIGAWFKCPAATRPLEHFVAQTWLRFLTEVTLGVTGSSCVAPSRTASPSPPRREEPCAPVERNCIPWNAWNEWTETRATRSQGGESRYNERVFVHHSGDCHGVYGDSCRWDEGQRVRGVRAAAPAAG